MVIPAPQPRSTTHRSPPGEVTCAVCGSESRQVMFRAGAPEQAPDLDLRPGEPLRSTMGHWLQQCPRCGYAAPDISQARPSAARVVGAAPFRSLVSEVAHPPLSRRFLAWAHVLEETGAMHEAAEAMLQAAWTADDLNRQDLARNWRLEAVALWRSGPGLDAEQQVRVVDALRRAEAWDGAADAIAAMLRDQPPEAVRQVLALESRLVESSDARRHTVASALPPPARRPHVAHQKLAGRSSLFGWFRRLFGRR
ncbi:hypothetical protein [Rhodovarius sp.]|uniref:hypothetical protein n=1 Tax=Rhodovarius sp. TaxID=2972673 RepID=UPI003340F365